MAGIKRYNPMNMNSIEKIVIAFQNFVDDPTCMVTHIARVWINRVRLPVQHVVS